jgi:hypothetical protein
MLPRRPGWTNNLLEFFEWLVKVSLVALACFLRGRAKDLSAPRYFFPMAQHSLVDQGLLIVEASRLNSDAPHWVGLLWTSDQPVAETLPANAQH